MRKTILKMNLFIIVSAFAFLSGLFIMMTQLGYAMAHSEEMDKHTDHQEKFLPVKNDEGTIEYYTCGMHPNVRVSVERYQQGDINCPICNMRLVPVIKKKVSAQDQEFNDDTISKVNIKARGLKLAGVQTEVVHKRKLYKDIHAVGRVAYDPNLAIAQDEFISAIKAYEKAKDGSFKEIIDRSKSLVDSSRRKLLLLGLSADQIAELAISKEVQTNLILPSEQMWIYGDVYEYALPWIHKEARVKATPIGLTGVEFEGEVVSINPVVDPRSRSVRFRALINEANGQLKPEMYVDVEILSEYVDPHGQKEIVALPKSALLDTGRRKIVWVDKGNGDFEGRAVDLGPEAIAHMTDSQKYYPVLKGIRDGEKVVTKGNFLIDSQSQITGVVASSYGGALEPAEESKQMNATHIQH